MACITTIKNATKIKSQNWNCLLMGGVTLTDLSHFLYLAKSRPTAHFRSKLDCTFLRYKARRRSWTWKIYLKSRKNSCIQSQLNAPLFVSRSFWVKASLSPPTLAKRMGSGWRKGKIALCPSTSDLRHGPLDFGNQKELWILSIDRPSLRISSGAGLPLKFLSDGNFSISINGETSFLSSDFQLGGWMIICCMLTLT